MARRKWGRLIFLTLRYALAVFMIVAGILTGFGPTDTSNNFGWLYNSREVLITYGALFAASGSALLYGLVRRKRQWVGRGLMATYLCFMFAAALNATAVGVVVWAAWVPNVIASLLVAVLYLQWRFRTEYVDPKRFTTEVQDLLPKDEPHECN